MPDMPRTVILSTYCLTCGRVESDPEALETRNDYGLPCDGDDCDSFLTLWSLSDGVMAVTYERVE